MCVKYVSCYFFLLDLSIDNQQSGTQVMARRIEGTTLAKKLRLLKLQEFALISGKFSPGLLSTRITNYRELCQDFAK